MRFDKKPAPATVRDLAALLVGQHLSSQRSPLIAAPLDSSLRIGILDEYRVHFLDPLQLQEGRSIGSVLTETNLFLFLFGSAESTLGLVEVEKDGRDLRQHALGGANLAAQIRETALRLPALVTEEGSVKVVLAMVTHPRFYFLYLRGQNSRCVPILPQSGMLGLENGQVYTEAEFGRAIAEGRATTARRVIS